MAILMPALQRAREQGKRSVCLNNAKTLALGWIMYCDDHDGKMPKGQAREEKGVKKGWVFNITNTTTNPSPAELPKETQLEDIMQGELYKYVQSVKVYRCPVAKSNEMRTYSISHAMNGMTREEGFTDAGTVLRNLHEIKHPAQRLVFIDDFADDWDAAWAVPWNRPGWWNTVPARHGAGTVASFADSRSEWWAWKDRRTIELMEKYDWYTGGSNLNGKVQQGNPDLLRIQKAVWGDLGYNFEGGS
jgi:hypothetical protein